MQLDGEFMSVGQTLRRLVAAHPNVQFMVVTSIKLPPNHTPAWMYTVGASMAVNIETLAALQLTGINVRSGYMPVPTLSVYRLPMESLYTVKCDVITDRVWHFVDFKPPQPLDGSQASGHPLAAALLTPQATTLAQLVNQLCTVLQGTDYASAGKYLESIANQRRKEEVYRYAART